MNRLLQILLFAVVMMAAPRAAHALSCSASITNVDFGAANVLSTAPTDVTATVTVTCTSIPVLASIKMCAGIEYGSGGVSGASRVMVNGAERLTYQLFQDSSRTVPWGDTDDTSQGTAPLITLYGGTSGTATATRTLYARLFGGQSTAPTGTYLSTFSSAETSFQYSGYYFSTGSTCTGFVGSAVVRPSFTVQATATPYCRIATNSLDFGSAGVITSALNSSGAIALACTNKTPFAVALDNGRTGSGPTARKMTLGTNSITYGLYRDAARSQPWGPPGSGQTASGVGSGSDQILTIYGAVPAQATPPPGAYSDTVVATVTY